MMSLTAHPKDLLVGEIIYDVTAKAICPLVEDGDTITLTSPGGSVDEGMLLVDCIREKDVLVRVKEAHSAATYLVFGAKRLCLYPDAKVGLHSPYTLNNNGTMVDISVSKLRSFMKRQGSRMMSQGYDAKDVYFILGVTMLTPSYTILVLPEYILIDVLQERYVGQCK